MLGKSVGAAVGPAVGLDVGAAVGPAVGRELGRAVGTSVGTAVGAAVGTAVGAAVGAAVGSVKQTVKILITKGQDENYIVHHPQKIKIYTTIGKAIKASKIDAKAISEKKCIEIGAKSIKTKIKVLKNEFIINKNKTVFLECNVVSTCYGKII